MTTIPEGWQLVPKVATPEMTKALYEYAFAEDSWQAVLAAAPPPPAEEFCEYRKGDFGYFHTACGLLRAHTAGKCDCGKKIKEGVET